MLLSREGRTSRERTIFFFNPLTRQKIDLPQLSEGSSDNKYSFTSSPTSSDCYVAAVTLWGEICVIELHKCTCWKIYKYLDDLLPINFSHPVFHEERCYVLTWSGRIIAVDLKHQRLSVKGEKLSQLHQKSHLRNYLVEDDGELFAIFVFEHDQRILVKGLSLRKPDDEWHEVDDLGNRMIFVSHGRSLVRTSHGVTRNKIYFPKFYPQMSYDGNIVCYSPTTRKYHAHPFLGHDYCAEIPAENVTEYLNSMWIE